MGPNITRMLELMGQAQFFQDQIEEMEDKAFNRVKIKRAEGTLQGNGEDMHDLYYVAKDLDENFWYKRGVSKRNSYVTRATMHGIAALILKEEP